jgi:hypothetical protein
MVQGMKALGEFSDQVERGSELNISDRSNVETEERDWGQVRCGDTSPGDRSNDM